jgi:hypothetical protein
MKTKIPYLILAGLFGTAMASQAAVIVDVFDADFDPDAGQFGTTSLGTLSRDQNVVDGAGPQTLQYTVSGLTIDDDGTANDSVTITFSASAFDASSGNTNINSGVNNGSGLGFFAHANGWSEDDDILRMDFTNITVDVSGGGFSAAEFLGFTALTVQNGGNGESGDAYTVNGDLYSFDTLGDFSGAGSTNYAVSPSNSLELEGVSFGTVNGGGSYRWQDMDFQFSATAVPEPSSTALLGLGGLALMLRRKRS